MLEDMVAGGRRPQGSLEAADLPVAVINMEKCKTATDGRGAAISCGASEGGGDALAEKHDANGNAVRRAMQTLHRQVNERRVAAVTICTTTAMARQGSGDARVRSLVAPAACYLPRKRRC